MYYHWPAPVLVNNCSKIQRDTRQCYRDLWSECISLSTQSWFKFLIHPTAHSSQPISLPETRVKMGLSKARNYGEKKYSCLKIYSVVSHPSTSQAWPCLASEIRGDRCVQDGFQDTGTKPRGVGGVRKREVEMAGVGEGGWGKMHTIEQLKKDKKNNISCLLIITKQI